MIQATTPSPDPIQLPPRNLATHPAEFATPPFPPLDRETRAGVETDCAAFHLNRSPQTLRKWAMGTQRAPIQPRRVNGRLMWATADLRKLCGV